MEDLPLFQNKGKKIYKVSEITEEIKVLLEAHFEYVWVEGEISNFRVPASGHFYFTLKDASSQIRAVMFRSQNRLLAFQPEDGIHVACRGRITVYGIRGEYQLILDFMEPRGTGALQLAFEQLKKKLHEEGLFDPAKKLPLPFLPKKIAVVTSPTGAAIRDILNILFRRYPNIEVLIAPVRVQGEGAAEEIAQAIEDLNGLKEIEVVILARGGGSLEDLWSFNEEVVARAIFQSRVPVVSAIGHEIDFTISDFAADLRAPTPSAAAELVARDKKKLVDELRLIEEHLSGAINREIARKKETTGQLSKGLGDPRRRFAELRLRLDDSQERLNKSMALSTRLKRDAVSKAIASVIHLNPMKDIKICRQDLSRINKILQGRMEINLSNLRKGIEKQMSLLDSLSPLSVLKRGYAIARKVPTMEILQDAASLHMGDLLQVTFHKGKARCRVEDVNPTEDHSG